jgi:uncharacterized protein YcfJ
MKKLFIALPLVAALAACETQNQSTATGALAGAALGAAVSSSDDRFKGAVIGGIAGGAAGNYVGKSQGGKCVYQNSAGQRYTAACP